MEARGRNETHEGNKKPFNVGDKGKRKFKGNGKNNISVKKEGENLYANIVRRMAMMKTIVGNFILKEDPKSSATKGSQRLLQLYNMI